MPVAPPQDWLRIIFRAFCLVLPPLSLLSQQAVVPWLLIVAVAACAVVWRAERRLPIPDRSIAMGFAALLLWCAIASLWGFDLMGSLFLLLRIGAIFTAALVLFAIARGLDDRIRENLGNWLLAGILIALVLMVVELFFGYPINEAYFGISSEEADFRYRLNRGATAMVMMAWPAAALLWRRGSVWGVAILFAAVAAMLGLMESNSAILGAIAGLAAASVSLLHRKAGRAMVVLVTIVALAGTTLAAQEMFRRDWQSAEWLDGSARHRVEIWNYTADWIVQKPLTGWGFDASRAFRKDRLSDGNGTRQLLPLHPHNAPLQILLELGAVGAAIVFVLLMLLAGRISRLPRPERICGQALFVSTLAISCAAYGLWQNQWLAMMCAAALLIPLTSPILDNREFTEGEKTTKDRAASQSEA
ncbi:MAG: O-antigen ligase family protein [Alphaproteobacteria bacterium]|nr:MAG: O-antigen ligase family protein [Alphaproteobacteria bacterium]